MKVSPIALVVSMFLTPFAGSQQGSISDSSTPSRLSGRSTTLPNANGVPTSIDSPDSVTLNMEAQREKLRNDERQKKLVDETNRLLDLANQLKTEVDKSGKDTLSITVIKKADEIEKLARSVKERMKG